MGTIIIIIFALNTLLTIGVIFFFFLHLVILVFDFNYCILPLLVKQYISPLYSVKIYWNLTCYRISYKLLNILFSNLGFLPFIHWKATF